MSFVSESQIESLQVMAKVTNYLSKYNSTNFVETDDIKFGAFMRLIQSSNYALVTEIYQNHFPGNVHFVDGLNLLRKGYQHQCHCLLVMCVQNSLKSSVNFIMK